MSNFNLTIDDLEKQSGLSRKYIDRCYARFGSVLVGYRRRSPDQNKYLYDANSVAIFLHIRDLKEGQGMKLPEIRDRMIEELGRRTPAVEKGREVEEKDMGSSLGAAPSADTKTFIAALKDAYEMAITSERGKVLLLEETLEMRKKREQEYIDKIATIQAMRKRRGELLSKLESLEAKWFAAKKKREIINEIRRIDSEAENDPMRVRFDNGSGNPAGGK